jgi:hypothetical protein
MADFFDRVEWETARSLEALARLSLELRDARAGVLRHYDISHEDELLERIVRGECGEHPAYEHALALRILGEAREDVRRLIAAQARGVHQAETLHQLLQRHVRDKHATAVQDAQLTLDALALRLANGLALQVHYAAPDAYSLRWQDGQGRGAGIDTAPAAHGLAGTNHLHRADGRVVEDTVTRVGAPASENLDALLRSLQDNPAFGLEA